MDLQLRGKRCLVTGAGAGIGRAVAHVLADEGAAVAIAARSTSGLESLGREMADKGNAPAAVLAADLTKPEDLEGLISQLRSRMASVEVLVNAAGASRPLPDPLADQSLWDEAFALNFTAARRLAEGVIPDMRRAGWGRIVNLTGAPAHKSLNAATPAKAALLSWSRSIAGSLAADGITINCVAPGRINSAQILGRLFPTKDARDKEIAANIPMGRFGDPEEAACLVAFLASPLAGYITAASIPVDGGMYRLDLK